MMSFLESNGLAAIPAYRDTVVHSLFGTKGNEYILLDFVNSVLDEDNLPLAKSVETKNPFNPQTFVTEKYTVLDIKATDESGNVFVVEFQSAEKPAFANRMLYYCSKSYCSQMSKNDPFTVLQPVIGIAVTAYDSLKHLPGAHNSFYFRSKNDTSVIFTDGIQMHVLEITSRKAEQFGGLKPRLRCWMNLLYYADKKGEKEMTALLADNPVAQQAYEEWKRFNSDERMRSVEQAHEFFMHDVYTAQHVAREKALAEGRAAGLAAGLAEGRSAGRVEGITMSKIEIARSALQMGMKIEDIVRLTGLSSGEIERLQ